MVVQTELDLVFQEVQVVELVLQEPLQLVVVEEQLVKVMVVVILHLKELVVEVEQLVEEQVVQIFQQVQQV